MISRLPPIERWLGFDRMTVWHRTNGKLVVGLVAAHVVLTTTGYALVDRLAIPSEGSRVLVGYSGMIAATVGTALFFVILLSSIVIVRRGLRYETWCLVHVFAYLGIALAWFHQLPTGNEFITNRAATDYWESLYLFTLVAVIAYRVIRPAVRAARFRLRVDQVIEEAEDVVSIHITGRYLDQLGARAGQFFLWRFLDRRRGWQAHPFSLSASPDGERLRITVKGVGDFSRQLRDVRVGTRIVAEGPFGVFTADARQRDRTVLIAGGIGITPIRALLEDLSGDLVLLYRAASERDIVFRDELARLQALRGVRTAYIVGDHRDPACRTLLSPEHLRRLVPDIVERDVYVCGPPAMMMVLERNVRLTGVPRGQIHSEKFAL